MPHMRIMAVWGVVSPSSTSAARKHQYMIYRISQSTTRTTTHYRTSTTGSGTEKIPHTLYVTPPHEPDHWRPTINADVHRQVGPSGTQTSQGKGRGGGSNTGRAPGCRIVRRVALLYVKKALLYIDIMNYHIVISSYYCITMYYASQSRTPNDNQRLTMQLQQN